MFNFKNFKAMDRSIKDGAFHIRKNVRSGSLQLVRVPEMTINVENVVAKCPRI